MTILIFDTETTGLDINQSEIFEIAWIIVDVDFHIVDMFTKFIKTSEDLPPEVVKITGVKNDTVKKYGVTPINAFANLHGDIKEYGVTHISGHNIVNYDLPLLKANLARTEGFSLLSETLDKLKVIDTISDLPCEYPTKKLTYLAAEHNFINPWAHRALFDVLTCYKLLRCYEIEKVLELAESPSIEIRALVSFEKKDLAAKRGYKWDPTRKFWVKSIKTINLEKEQDHMDFAIQVL